MNLFHRAYTYLVRKKVKSIMMLLLLSVIFTLMMTSTVILRATKDAALEFRQQLGGMIKVELDKENGENWNYTQAAGGSYVDYIGEPITDSVIQEITNIKGVIGYNGISSTGVVGINFQFIPGNIGQLNEVTAAVSAFSEYYNYFYRGSFRLTEGNHFTDKDKHVAIISQELAAYNELSLGDKIELSSTYGIDDKGDEVLSRKTVMIVGIYENTSGAQKTEFNTTSTLLANRIMIDSQTLCDLEGNSERKYEDGVNIYVNDPAEIDKIIDEIKNLDVDLESFKISSDNAEYEALSSSLIKLQKLVYFLLVMIITFSVVVLSLILSFFIRSRVHETGILLSIGVKKQNIIGQYLIEMILIAVFASVISHFSSVSVMGNASTFLQQQIEDKIEQPGDTLTDDDDAYYFDITGQYENYDISKVSTVSAMDPKLELGSMIIVYIIGFFVILLSIFASCIGLIRLTPREILTLKP